MNTYFIDKIGKIAEKYPDRPALALNFHEAVLTYSGLWEQSGRIYAALKQAGIGREDIVMLFLPRHPMMIAALIGVLRAGAAVTIIEDTYPEERVRFIRNDCGVRLVIDRDFFEKAMACRALKGREPLYLHDACFIFYTSGTTGTPKGILHEYGKLDIGIGGSITDEEASDPDECGRFAYVPPFNFAATVIHALPVLYQADTLYILSYDVSKNFGRFHELLEKEKITELFLTPSVLRNYREGFAGVRTIMTGSEPASNLFIRDRKVIVCYAMTESLYCVSRYELKRSLADAPIASKESGKNIRILGEDGLPVKDGETGEICFPDPYFRGYIHMPEKTCKVFQDGWFHSGDLGFRDKNGDVFILGRSDDMIKINGNRIEPGEIEEAARAISGLKNVIAKGFCEENRSYVALYYLKGEAEENCIFRTPERARQKMGEKLPYYMIPSYFVGIDALPLNQNGKTSRKLLKAPETDTFRKESREPVGQAEKDLCGIMAEVLSLDKTGPDEDFYEIGGDSVSAICMISECVKKGYKITIQDLLEARTAAGLAAKGLLRSADSEEERIGKENAARQTPVRLLAGQELYLRIFEKYPKHSSICVPVLAFLKGDTDLLKFRDAVDKVIAHHPALLSRFRISEDGKTEQYYDARIFCPTVIEDAADDMLKAEIGKFLKPTDITKDRLYAVKIIRTQTRKVFLFSVHHIVSDGTSNSILLDEIAACYRDPDRKLPPDFYYTVCREAADGKFDLLRKEAEVRNKEMLEILMKDDSAVLKPDLPGPDSGSASFVLPEVLPKSKKYRNRTFIAGCLMAMAWMNGRDSALVYAAYNGRDSVLKENSAGCYTDLIPVFLTGIREKSAEALLSEIQEQLDFGITHSVYPAITESGLVLDRTLIFNYQYGTMNFGKFREISDSVFMMRRAEDQPNCLFNIGILDREESDRLDFYCNYPKGIYTPDKIRRFGEYFVKAVRMVTGEI